MKKIFFSLAALMLSASMMAQTPEDKAAAKAAAAQLKANQSEAKKQVAEAVKLRDAAKLVFQNVESKPEQLEAAYQQTQQGLDLVTKALNSGYVDEKKLYEAWFCSDELSSFLMNREIAKAAQNTDFDTLAFHNSLGIAAKSKQNVIKYGNPKDELQKNPIQSAKQQLANQLMTFFAYDGQFNMTSRPNIALQSFDTYINYPTIFPEVADFESVKTPKTPREQIAYYAFMTAYEAKNPQAMDKYYDLAIQFQDGADGVKQRKIFYYLQQGDTVRWAEECKKMALADPTNNEDMIQNLLAYYQTKGMDKMSAFADEVLAVAPDNVIANYAKGYILFAADKYAEALPLYQKCVEIKPDYVDALIQCGMCLNNMGNAYNRKISTMKFKTQAAATAEENKVKDYFRQAIPYYEKVQELVPDDPNKWAYELKVCYTVLGDKAKAAEYEKLAQ